jgi:hypothetical protein
MDSPIEVESGDGPCRNHLPLVFITDSLGGAERTRTADPLLAKQVLYQLSYRPNETPV